jgi:hypothetical protein
VLALGALPELDGERLDLGMAAVTIAGADVQAVEAMLKSARAGATPWQGPGIGTSAATAHTGLVPLQQGADVLVKYSYNGDANGDGAVNFDDYFRIDSGFLEQPPQPAYADGDFNFDDVINFDDYFLIDSAFMEQGAPLGATASSSQASAATSTAAPVVSDEEPRKSGRRTRDAASSSLFSEVRVRPRARAGR